MSPILYGRCQPVLLYIICHRYSTNVIASALILSPQILMQCMANSSILFLPCFLCAIDTTSGKQGGWGARVFEGTAATFSFDAQISARLRSRATRHGSWAGRSRASPTDTSLLGVRPRRKNGRRRSVTWACGSTRGIPTTSGNGSRGTASRSQPFTPCSGSEGNGATVSVGTWARLV